MKPYIRWWIRRDMFDILKIEKDVFGANAQTEEEFLKLLRERNIIGMVVEDRSHEQCPIIGYMLYELHKKKLHLLHMVVKPECQGKGVGKTMVKKLANKLSTHRRTALTLEIRESWIKAIHFFKKMGFLAQDVIRNYYDDPNEDAYYMVFTPQVLAEGAK